MDAATPPPGWLQTGSSIGFAGIVLYLLFQLKPVLLALLQVNAEIKSVLAALLERERARAERIAATEAARAASLTRAENWDVDAETNPLSMPVEPTPPKRRTDPHGVPVGQYGLKREGR